MPSNPLDITQIPAPRVDFIDKRTGLMAREWYRFFVNIYNLAGGGNSTASLDDLQVGQVSGASFDSIAEMMKTLQELEIQPPVVPSSGGTTYSVFTSTTNGLAPASGGGTVNYLRADGTWATPPGTGGVTFANPTATVGPTATNGVAVTAMRSDAAPAINLTANYTYTGQWTFSRAGTTSALNIYANATTYQCVLGFAGSAEFKMDIASSATGLGVYVSGTKYLAVTAGNVDVPAGTLTVASTSVRDGGILTSGTVNAARLPTFGTAAAGIVPASGGGTTNFLRADGTWAAPPSGGVTDGDKGDITVSSSGTVWTIDATVVTNAKLANVATATFKGRTTAGTGSPEDLTGTQATALLDTFTSTLKGLAPLSGGGTTNYLRADGTWAAPPGTGGVSFANPTASVGLTAVNGVATSAMRSDAAPALDVTIAPTWSGLHTFSQRITNTSTTSGSAATGAYTYGTLSYSDSNNLAVLQSTVNAYNQLIVQNTNVGAAASADLTISNNNGTATTFYGNFGMNSSGWAGTAGTSTLSAPNVVYLTATSGDLAIGTTTANPIRFVTGGGSDAAIFSTLGQFGIGVGSPTAMLHLVAGTASANTAPLKLTSGTNLTTAEAGAYEYDGTVSYFTNDASSGRGYKPAIQIFRLTANGTAFGPAIGNFFNANSAVQLIANGKYEIEAYCRFTKTTAGTVTVTATTSVAPLNLSGSVDYGAAAGGTATGAANRISLFNSTATAAAFGASVSLTNGASHLFIVRLIVEAAASASNLRINFTSSAGTVTPLRTSYYKVTKLPSGNSGVFVA
jgi:hypothetical protein